MTLSEYIAMTKPQMQQHLSNFLINKKKLFARSPQMVDMLDRLNNFSQKGKMLRGILLLLVYESFAKQNLTEPVLDLAVAMELTQSGLLIHDDIMDNDVLRRGEKSIYAQYQDIGSTNNVPVSAYFGQSLGMCAGDLTFFLAFELMASGSKSHRSQLQMLDCFTHLIERCIGGQVTDYLLGSSMITSDEQVILAMYLDKTGYYSLVLPLLLGGMMANVEQKTLHTLEEIGKHLGVIFQIKDDQLGLIGQANDIGKIAGSDIRENKKTLIRHILYSIVSSEEKIQLDAIFGNHALTTKDFEQVITLYHMYRVEEKLEKIVTPLVTLAQNEIQKLPNQSLKDIFDEFLRYNLFRKK